MNRKFIDRLAARLQEPLPGQEAQFSMAHVARRNAIAAPTTAREASVLALFYPKANDWHLVLIERQNNNMKDRHGGQISFPGGKYEDQDTSLEYTALREAEEEVGVDAMSIEILGALTELYIPVSNFRVNPFVGFLDHAPAFTPQVEEVRSVLEVPFNLFQDPANQKLTDLKIAPNLMLRNVPYFDVSGKIIWGATAMMLGELLAVLDEN